MINTLSGALLMSYRLFCTATHRQLQAEQRTELRSIRAKPGYMTPSLKFHQRSAKVDIDKYRLRVTGVSKHPLELTYNQVLKDFSTVERSSRYVREGGR
jgi:DMSO/TMAO reductase YedYZ molybdopterin-dependent catalytic subunit